MEQQLKLSEYQAWLYREERSSSTIRQYTREIKEFLRWKGERDLEKTLVLAYKEKLQENLKTSSVNTKLAALNGFFVFQGRSDLKVKKVKTQRRIFASAQKELTKREYERLVKAAENKGNERLALVIQTICATGIRISELKYITRDALRQGNAVVACKGKVRIILIPKALCKKLDEYCLRQGVKSGSVFVSKNGNPLDRSNVWSDMKKLCRDADVNEEKVFPHNLRHLFARTYYHLEKDLNRLADLLGHSCIETTRIYTMTGTVQQERSINRLGLVV